ncbi:hypothetical protein EGT74_13735 [Chitinophaga lutea]|uniref:Thioredoxin domain-containing protein n=1 Tax=Chitinophaga lutea TaxID=2488634 RepID=A0A3N4PJX5_9BACT|nr:redoxin family protein [Chitinophaga lutea]RPE08125.1 hypothetical protein EGT74_13735 [Chitinophaga lutea]
MKKHILTLSMIVMLAAAGQPASAQRKAPTASPEEIAQLRADVEKQPEDLKAHEAYMKAAVATNPEVQAQYDKWIKKYPTSATIPFAIGKRLTSHEDPRAEKYLLKALKLDPKMAAAWSALSNDVERRGDFEKTAEYLRKATEAEPGNADYAFYYAMRFDDTDPAKYEALCLDLIKRFPESQRAAQALYWLSFRLEDPAKKLRYAQMMSNEFPPEKYSWSRYGMDLYWDILLKSDPAKALQVTERMTAMKDTEEYEKTEWARRHDLTARMIKARQLAARPDDALQALQGANPRRDAGAAEELVLLKASLEAAAGRNQPAYDSLLKFQERTPSDKVHETLVTYGSKLGKTSAAVNADIRAAQLARAEAATPFTLDAYLTKKPVSLADYKGKVVLLTYWFPGCGPCRGEFPHFENVLKKYKGKDVVYLAINIVREQDAYVLPFVKNSGYTFTPLAEDPKRNKGNLKSPGAPTNYLIDQDGRIIYSNFMIHGNNERMLELMIDSMLAPKAG